MSLKRKKLSEEETQTLLEPLLEAVSIYFDGAYEGHATGKDFCSMCSGASDPETKELLIVQAFRVPHSEQAFVYAMLTEIATRLQSRITIDRPDLAGAAPRH